MDEMSQSLKVRVYYEDTDFSGRVYHASYFRFFERGRTEWLRAIGLAHNQLAESSGVAFAVRRLEADFRAPAFIDDLLEVKTSLRELKGPMIRFHQIVSRESTALVACEVDVVCIKGNLPVKPPRELLLALGFRGR